MSPSRGGSEQIWALTERYCGRSSDRRRPPLSLQRHARKEESLIVLSGHAPPPPRGRRRDRADARPRPGDSAHVDVPRMHRFEAVTDVELVEVSTPEIDE
jgi:hypothetical protein